MVYKILEHKRWIFMVLFLIICILGTFFFIKYTDNINTHVFISEILIYKDDNEYEIKIENETGYTYFRENNSEEIIYRYPRQGMSRISVPLLDNIEGVDILKSLKPYVDFTYNVSFEEGSKYLKYLLNEGYDMEMYVSTSQYFECFLKKENTIKRVVLLSDSLMVCDLIEGSELPSVKEYLENYNFNNSLDKYFSE